MHTSARCRYGARPVEVDDAWPVLVGVGVAAQRHDDPDASAVAIQLMHQAVAAAIDDAGGLGGPGPAAALIGRVGWIGVPEGTWSYRDPGRLVARRLLGDHEDDRADMVHTVVADVGILQQQLVDEAIEAIVSGRADVALVVGGEAKHRQRRGAITGRGAPETNQPDATEPDERLTPGSTAALGVNDLEITRNTVTPVAAYALIENAIAHDLGRSLDEHRDEVAALWARVAAVAVANPDAWDRSGPAAAAIRDAGPGNRMISFPHTKRHSAQWNVDQAAALVLCDVSTARALGVATDRWVFPHASAVANHAVAVSERAAIHRSIGAEIAGPRVLELAGITTDDLAHIDLYSCFPSAVQLLAGALGLDLSDPRGLSVTGGLTFAGGPLNNYVLQALVTLARRLRAEPGSYGLSTSVSGFVAKQGFSVWSSAPPPRGWVTEDVTSAVAAATKIIPIVEDHHGPGAIASWTIDYRVGAPDRSVAILDVAGGRTIAENRDPAVADRLLEADPIGRAVTVVGGSFELP